MKFKAYIKDNKDKLIFGCVAVISYLMILVYNCLTPHMADDYLYLYEVSKANSFWDLVLQEYNQYMTINGRSVNHLLLRCFMSFDKTLFNVINALAFEGLSLMLYKLSNKKKKYNISLYILVQVFLWQCSVKFGQTILWESGACNYLWPALFIFSMATIFSGLLERKIVIKHSWFVCVCITLLGVIAGWGNENTSGGLFFLLLLWTGYYCIKHKRIEVWMACGLVGVLTGFCLMIGAPGYRIRSTYFDEEYSGIVLLFSRFYKITLEIKDWFLILIIIYIVLMVVLVAQKIEFDKLFKSISCFLAFLATCYALILSPTPQSRVFFGAGFFLMVSILQLWELVEWDDKYLWIIKNSVVIVSLVLTLFVYFEEGFNVARIYREYTEREEYIIEQKELGEEYITVPMLRPQFDTKYSCGYEMDFQEESNHWLNLLYAYYYNIEKISAMPREEWTKY